jgi:RNA polymerase sigma factor (TIGR02999 family)
MTEATDITLLLLGFASGNRDAGKQLVQLVYDELRRLAHQRRFRWQEWNSPGTTSLVHEAYLKLVDHTRCSYENRSHFLYFASIAMKNILIDNARRSQRIKRRGEVGQVPVEEDMLVSEERTEEILAIDEALTRLKERDPRIGEIVECRFFGGLTVEETSEALSLSPATVKRGWDAARAWLFKELKPVDRPQRGAG